MLIDPTRIFESRVARASDPIRRLGITASRKVAHAVTRNRLKRGIREWFRVSRDRFEEDVDVVVIVRRAAAELPSNEMSARLSALSDRLTLTVGAPSDRIRGG